MHMAHGQVRVANVGAISGAEVAQLYLTYPAAAAEPPLVLRAFESTGEMRPGEAVTLHLGLSRRDLSIWKVGSGWEVVDGAYTLSVGSSSRDLRLTHTFELRSARRS